MSNIRSRGWCFTINNDRYKDLKELITLCDSDYLIFGFEKGKSGTSHIQGYLYFDNARSFQSIKRFLPRAHIEPAKGTPEQNHDYCTKDGLFFEFGEIPEPGKRTDLDNIKKMVKKGNTMLEIAEAEFGSYIRYHKGIEKYMNMTKSSKVNDDESISFSTITPKEAIDLISQKSPSVYVATSEADMIGWCFEPTLIIYNPAKFDTYKLELLEKCGIAYKIRNGYELIQIRPKKVFIVKM